MCDVDGASESGNDDVPHSSRDYVENLLAGSQTELAPLLEMYARHTTEFTRDHPCEFVAISSDGVLGFSTSEDDLISAFYAETDRSLLIRQIPCVSESSSD